jgi:hypothetical protein
VRVFCALSLLFRAYNLSTGPSVDRQLRFLRPVCCLLVRLEISVELPGRSRSVCVLANSLLRYRNASKTGARLHRSPSFQSWHTIEKQCSGSWVHVRAHTDACFHVRVCVCVFLPVRRLCECVDWLKALIFWPLFASRLSWAIVATVGNRCSPYTELELRNRQQQERAHSHRSCVNAVEVVIF